ncbi:putative membrane protein [Asticcacaulis biprosthecium C19]|uniref:Putative membrane protein n=1 Tax=Asticcacaulis biprosthecium C19 TaxID=715226 RepID=F4QH44_9CAUL|nr:hypothetical protein [Asticcacaulis biprosthecium]EGF92581.1 putative membrane protein [Asticcacaulis biprosthecium C19]
MTLVEKLVKPKRLIIAGCIMSLVLTVAIAVEYYTNFDTIRYVRTAFYFLVLEYIWASVRREFFDGKI